MPPRKTKNAAPNQRDTRHENGLAQPGKRVSKKQSNGQLDGQPNGKPLSAVPPPALPTTGLNQGLRFPRPAEPADNASQTVQKDDAAATEGTRRHRTASEDPLEGVGGDMTDNVHETAYAAPSAEAHQSHTSTCGSSTPPTGTPPTSVSTILTYYPLRDAISILILLLSLPPTLVLVIQSLFASLTFVPPTAGLSISTWPNIKEMFNASNFGYPAMATILIVDFIFWAFWLPLWKPVQNIFLDFSQAVIAVSLSGAAASTGGPTYSIATSTLVVCVVHVLRYKAIHLTALDYLRSVMHRMDLSVQLDVPPFASSFFSPPPIERGWPFTVIRTILGIHIVSQGVTTCIRRSLVKANERDQGLPAITKSDPEAAPGAEPTSRSATISEGSQLPHTASATDLRSPGPSPAEREGKARDWSSKKKKKQATQVRSQQPLWAAVASTKVTFVKEMEQRDAADDARDAAAMYTNRTPVFISTTYPTTSRLWISEVRDTEICFSIGLSPEAAAQSAQRGEQDVISNNPGIDKSKPFFVRVNGAAWSSTRIMSSATGSDVEGQPSFDGEIFGLAPRSNYLCEIVGIAAGDVLCSVRFTTQAPPSAEQTAAAPSQPQHPASRPSSPITTLKQSILSAEGKLNDVRNRTRKIKRDQRGAVSDIRKEINTLKTKLDSSGLDDKQERRIMQITQHKNQAEEATADLKREIDAFGDVPEDEVALSVSKRSTWQNAMNAKRRAEKDLDSAKAEADRELCAMKSDIEAAKSKRERMTSRHVQKAQELDKLAVKQHADTTAKQHREHERSQALQRREAEDVQFRFTISTMEAEANAFEAKAHEAYQQLAALQSWNMAMPAYPGYSSPPTPDGTLPGTNGSLGSLSPQTNGFPTYSSPHQAFQSPFHSAQPSMSHSNSHGPRARSSSMLSQYSGFTDAGEEYVFPPEPRHQYSWPSQQQQQQPQQQHQQLHAVSGAAVNTMAEDHKESEASSGSLTNGSTGSNSPRPNAKVFVPGASKVGTIGPPGKSREKVPQSPPGAIGSGR
ncbi:hypothetical protein LTR02_014362 [Friedmanniomyces endolithicus]|nr:hypothetical protein LTR94_017838 [Friedmanniomyces endolithicus]KAK0773971.1 hypothetical protein LTR59_015080 [Friedmanniomyces endolithicus]KAK0778271.1 hypothetical protein LTR38_014847 [Friedmanniomyces endolithicus]KAK0781013.1 hypothetical protein LTR75_014830 [Friedmanniomyces endolithicus]KAK0841235.1 hypothetical protein LTR03_010018 [Friedmanniomyces endolithicus]